MSMRRRHYTTDDSLQKSAEQMSAIRSQGKVPEFAHALREEGYGRDGSIPAYEKALESIESSRGVLRAVRETTNDPSEYGEQLSEAATTLSTVSHHPSIGGELPPTLRSLAVDMECLATGAVDPDRAPALAERVDGTLTDVYTILRTFHEASIHLKQQD